MNKYIVSFLLLIFSSCSSEFISCSSDEPCISKAELDRRSKDLKNPVYLSATKSKVHSSEIGNFVTTAIQKTYNLDFAFMPSIYYKKWKQLLQVRPGMSEVEIQAVLKSFPRGPENQILIGTMKGSKIKEFVYERSRENYAIDLETAGLWYSISFKGGLEGAALFTVDGRHDIDDDEYYRIAVSDDFYFGSAFPGYKFRNGFNFNFRWERYQGYVDEAVESYLRSLELGDDNFPFWSEQRGQVFNKSDNNLGFKRISEIQGIGHKSSLTSNTVKTKGIVTAVATAQWYPWNYDVYIQTQTPDEDLRTSEGLHVILTKHNTLLKLGDEIEVEGIVTEDLRENGMGETVLWVEDYPKIISRGNSLPEAVQVGASGRQIPQEKISTFDGPLMLKKGLLLSDGIDFWESLEGMRIKLPDLKVVGLRGGGEDLVNISNRFYLNLQVVAKDSFSTNLLSAGGGILVDFLNFDFNPEILTITTNHLTQGVDVQANKEDFYYYNIGDEFKGGIEGVLTYQKNLFGGGEYALVTPEAQENLAHKNIIKRNQKIAQGRGFVPIADRGTTRFLDKDNELTFATFNLENLAGNRLDRILPTGDVIAENLQCPDVVNLVEIQDNNGISFRGSADATETLEKLLARVQSKCPHKNYEPINIDPFLLAEGGQPGGNIRVALFFNKKKLSYTKREDGSIGSQASVDPNGTLTSNPGRIYPTDSVFKGTRRSFVVEFDVRSKQGEKVYVIGNHLNSKLGDIDVWGNEQFAVFKSDFKRSKRAAKINEFIRWIEQQNPNANIIVLGDFNALQDEASMQVLSGRGEQLTNMIFKLPENERYTTNHNGNSQALDYIFANKNLFAKCAEAEILHINSDFMGRVSDHDPVVMKACF